MRNERRSRNEEDTTTLNGHNPHADIIGMWEQGEAAGTQGPNERGAGGSALQTKDFSA